jgi:hypothetical protein
MNEWQGKLKYWEETLTQCRFVHHKYYLIWPGLEPGPSR